MNRSPHLLYSFSPVPARFINDSLSCGRYVAILTSAFFVTITGMRSRYRKMLRCLSNFKSVAIAPSLLQMENFLSTLYMCYKELDKRFAVVHGKKITKKARVEATVLNSLTPLSKAEICKILPDVSPTTVEAVLGVMVKTGSIRRIGAGRTTRYIKA